MAEIVGMLELGRVLDLIDTNLQKKYMREAMRAGAHVFRAAIRRRAPNLTGAMARAVTIKSLITRARRLTFLIGVRYDKGRGTQQPGVYHMFVERGTKHMGAQPFIKPAFDESVNAATNAVAEKLRARLGDLVK